MNIHLESSSHELVTTMDVFIETDDNISSEIAFCQQGWGSARKDPKIERITAAPPDDKVTGNVSGIIALRAEAQLDH
ncbi:MAG TPA: hypothetical protein VE079_13100 [Ensifer sp.]|nr:hypothetical protein [Ensifer sp.]